LSALLAIPATLNVVTPGRPWVSLATLPEGRWWLWQLPPELAITQHGVYVAVRLVVRVLACVAAVFVLVSTTRTDRVWHGLRSLGVPRLPIMMLSMMCRYLDSLARVAAEMHLARLSRTIARLDVRSEQRWVASNLAALFRRTYALASAVHLAMCARGYTGEMLTWKSAPWRVADTCLVGAVLAACAALTRLP
jgi:cobalt/nickel transport system permease protein